MPTFTDQMGRTITLAHAPQRIISLVPSQTELLFDLGLDEEVVGITKFCIHPESWFRSKRRVGGTKQINFETIAALQPDLIIGNKEENEREQIEQLMENYPVWMSDIQTLDGALDMIRSVGQLTARVDRAEAMTVEIANRFALVEKAKTPERVAYFIWKNPWMCAGGDTFIDHLLQRCGLENVFAHLPSRYPEITPKEIQEAAPQRILLSSEPYPFKEKHIEELHALVPTARIELVDGELFSWYGSRLLHTPEYLKKLI